MAERRALVMGNWKMNGVGADLHQLEQMMADIGGVELGCEVAIAPPFTLLAPAQPLLKGGAALAGQDCDSQPKGAHTGSISAHMLADMGCTYVIVGHSERRTGHGETDALVRDKAHQVQAAGMVPVVCVGEPLDVRESGGATAYVSQQIEDSRPQDGQWVAAYEPRWAIGTGKTASPEDIAEIHGAVRGQVGDQTRILYGGSVNKKNAAQIAATSDVDGVLVGGASLTAEAFLPIVHAFHDRTA